MVRKLPIDLNTEKKWHWKIKSSKWLLYPRKQTLIHLTTAVLVLLETCFYVWYYVSIVKLARSLKALFKAFLRTDLCMAKKTKTKKYCVISFKKKKKKNLLILKHVYKSPIDQVAVHHRIDKFCLSTSNDDLFKVKQIDRYQVERVS